MRYRRGRVNDNPVWNKTTIFRLSSTGKWCVSYRLPYSGPLLAFHDTWAEAMAEACEVEKAREHM